MQSNNLSSQEKDFATNLDHILQANLGKLTGGISPASINLAFLDWIVHFSSHPAKQAELYSLYLENAGYLIDQFYKHMQGNATGEYCVLPTPQDRRFVNKAWQEFPYSFLYESFLLVQNWWHCAATNVPGVSQHHTDIVDFALRQWLDIFSPANSILTNPEVIKASLEQQGKNFYQGAKNLLEDIQRYQMDLPPAGAENYVIGENIAITPGKVIYRNQLIELIQYTSSTPTVYPEPILITPAWIMKYYILDLVPKHSLVKFLVDKGHTVFIISWKNPTKKDWQLSMQDYLELGILSALDVINNAVPQQPIHLVGYCLGGTLAAIASAYLARENDHRLKSLTLLAAQTDFTEPGELGLFIDESQIAFLENIMYEKGYLDTHQMAGAFQLLRSNDLIWSRMIHDYLLGTRKSLTDLMAWNADATRLPYRMHSEYLRKLFLANQLAEGKYEINHKPVALTDIQAPIFVVATERDHVSPWKSVFKINLLTSSNVTFTLTTGGHNVGIVSLPSKTSKQHFRLSTLRENDRYIDPDTWFAQTPPKSGSWWPAWEKWLAKHSGEMTATAPTCLHPLADAPGTYVLQK